MTPEQIEIYRAMSPAKKLQVAAQLYSSARKLKAAGLRSQHPDWSEDQIHSRVKGIFLYDST